jgi:hypothetical protein
MGEQVLPSALTDRPFTVREARAAGLRYDQVRRSSLHAPTWAVRCLEEPAGLTARAAAFACGLPDDTAFSHVTAARLWRLPLPSRLENEDTDLDVIRDSAKERIRRRGCRGHRGSECRELVVLGGLRSWDWPTRGSTSVRWSGGAWRWTTSWSRVMPSHDSWRCSSSSKRWVRGWGRGCLLVQGRRSSVLPCRHASGRAARRCSRRRCPWSGRARGRRWRRGRG